MSIYFDNAATSDPKPPEVVEAVRRALTEEEIAGNREAAEGYAAIGRDLAEQGILYWGADVPADARTIALKQS